MSPTRLKILFGAAGVLLALLIWNWISGWGLVTVHVQSQPLSKIIQSIERQGGIKIVTNADLGTPTTMDVDRVPPAEAVDVLAAWLDGNWSVGYAVGPQKVDVAAGVAALADGGRDPAFARFGFGGFGGDGGGMDGTGSVIDARRVSWKVSPSDDQQLQSYLNQLSVKTGLMAIAPQSWNPTLASTPNGGEAASAIRALVRSAKGEMQEIFVIRVRNEDPSQTATADGNSGNRGSDGGFRGGPPDGGRGNFNPDWIAERAEARIAVLPAAEQEQAKKDFDSMRDMWQKMRTLPDAERRAAMEKFFNDPAVQDRMLERQMTRDAKRSPEKRAERFRQYIQRKQQMKSSS